ncbi:hypothetical protein BGX24_008697 [Mortierella sp. AD032]|nr:hypothetical protein BGX24_008697 [Mortierella sp. AD032]
MKIPTILSALVAMTIAVHAAPTPATNGTFTDDAALLASIPKYDYKTAEKLVAHYNEVVHGSNSLIRTNGAVKAAGSVSSDIIPFCVGYATNPVRVRVFKNKMTCDDKGWSTLFIYTAHTKQEKHHAPYPMCVGNVRNPDRSMFFSDRKDCSINGWKTDFAFYESGAKDGSKDANPLHQGTYMWQAQNPHRMMLYPYYPGDQHGWQFAYNLKYRSRYRLSSSSEMNWLKQTMNWHESAHKQISVSTASGSTFRCAQNLIQVWSNRVKFDGSGSTAIYPGNDSPLFITDAARDECSSLVKNAQIRAGRFNVAQTVTVIEVMLDNKVYAAASVESGSWMAQKQEHIRTALQESLRTGAPVAIANTGAPSNSISAFIQSTYVTIGGAEAYKAYI